MESYRELIVWQKSFELVKDVYQLTGTLPQSEKFGLVSQLRRCVVSIPSNIAEGSKRGTKKDYIQFLRIALGSSAELETQLLLVAELYNIKIKNVLNTVGEIQKMLYSMIHKLTPLTSNL